MVMDNIKIQGDRVVNPDLLILPEGHPLIEVLRPGTYKVIPANAANFNSTVKASPFSPVSVVSPVVTVPAGLEKDAPDLSDITVYSELVAKQRAVTKEIYYEIVFKVRNSSINALDVIGVDARIVGTEPEND